MRKFLLLPFVFLGLASNAQTALKDNRYLRTIERPVMQGQSARTPISPSSNKGGSRALSSILNSQRIGSAGNLLTIINGESNSVDVNDSLNLVTFIHRNDATGAPGTNIAQYRYDVSKNRGVSWTSNIGPITNNPAIDNNSVSGRFPQAVIYNPAGNTVADSSYLIYSGTWHNATPGGTSGSWQGEIRGRGQLSGNIASYNVNINQINTGKLNIASGMCKGAPGVFWNVNQDYTGTFAGGDAFTQGIVIMKGVWNTTTKTVDWTDRVLPATFEQQTDANGNLGSVATSFNISFDPSGQYGWAGCLGDITSGDNSVFQPILWKTVDFGVTWTGPETVSLEAIQGVTASLNPLLLDGSTPASLIPSTAFEADLSVDVNGNPHILTTIGSGEDWSIQAAGYGVWDITYDATAVAGCNWKGYKLADINTLRGDFTSDAPATTMDNRPLVSRSPDGHKLFFFWNETDINFTLNSDNSTPNLFGKAIDVIDKKITDLRNFTEGDTLWGGETANTLGGVFYGSIFPTVSTTCLVNGSTYNVPLVLTQIDYAFDPGPDHNLGASDKPAAFWYINNIDYLASEFSSNLDQIAPTVTLNGADTVVILVGSAYNELGATAFDCTDGVIVPVISGAPNPAVVGIYYEYYVATDLAGNSDTAVRVVIVGDVPVANFSFSFPNASNKPQFLDQTANFPTSWVWNFGDGSGSASRNPLKTYNSPGTFNVCLTASNSFGTSAPVCKSVVITTATSIEDVEFSQNVTVYPNPSTGMVTLTLEGNVTSDFSVTVYNTLGETVLATNNYKAGTTRANLNLSTVASGLYFVKVQTDKGTAVKHLTINHK